MEQQEPTESHGGYLHRPATRKKSMGESVKYQSLSHLQVSFKRVLHQVTSTQVTISKSESLLSLLHEV